MNLCCICSTLPLVFTLFVIFPERICFLLFCQWIICAWKSNGWCTSNMRVCVCARSVYHSLQIFYFFPYRHVTIMDVERPHNNYLCNFSQLLNAGRRWLHLFGNFIFEFFKHFAVCFVFSQFSSSTPSIIWNNFPINGTQNELTSNLGTELFPFNWMFLSNESTYTKILINTKYKRH